MKTIYDMAGIGIGPFNLGLAALAQTKTKLKCIFFDQNESFNWHTGMLLNGTKLQVPFHADLVTLADPRSPFSFLSYLQAKGALFRFTIREVYYPLRKQYNDYCRWVAGQLKSLQFSSKCQEISFDKKHKCYAIQIYSNKTRRKKIYLAKRIVLGVGTRPNTPTCITSDIQNAFHSEDYLQKKEVLAHSKRVTIVGSGQSAAEIFDDLLSKNKSVHWITRSARFFPLDYSKFALEMTSPDYIDHFYSLGPEAKSRILSQQSNLYKGINEELISMIYDKLYESSLEESIERKYHLIPGCTLQQVCQSEAGLSCTFLHNETSRTFLNSTDALILATGYKYGIPNFLDPIKPAIRWDSRGKYDVNRNYSIDNYNSLFIQNGEIHTHGFNAPDLGMGPYRNAVILNTILGKEVFKIEKNVPFQNFRGAGVSNQSDN